MDIGLPEVAVQAQQTLRPMEHPKDNTRRGYLERETSAFEHFRVSDLTP